MPRHLLAVVVLIALMAPLPAAAPPGFADPAVVAVLIRKLDADNFFTRQRAQADLQQMGKRVLPLLLVERNRTTSVEVRYRLGRIIEALTLDERLEALVRILGESDRQLRQRAGQSLLRAGPAALPLLRRELRDDLPAEQRQAIEKLISELSRGH
jgi:hypothetical protein